VRRAKFFAVTPIFFEAPVRIRSSVLAATALTLAACSKPAPSSAPPPEPPAAAAAVQPVALPTGPENPLIESATFEPALKVDLKASTKSASGLYYRDIVVGKGDAAVTGQQVSVKYVGSFSNGARFDEGTYPFRLGTHAVIPGWDEGVVGMRVGGKRQLIVPPDLGYGANGYGKIPPNAILVFTTELVSVQK
jgi:hypothetical protein